MRKTYNSPSGDILATVSKNLFGDGFVVNLSYKPTASSEYHRTKIKFIEKTLRRASNLARHLCGAGVVL